MTADILKQFSIEGHELRVQPFGSGLINHTWLVNSKGKKYILQKINGDVFKTPEQIDHNIMQLATYLGSHYPGYLFTKPAPTVDNTTLLQTEDNHYFRLYPFVENSRTYIVVQDIALAYEAAKQFGKFTRLLSGFSTANLHITVPEFHNLLLRYTQFEQSVPHAAKERVMHAAPYIEALTAYRHIVDTYTDIIQNPAFIQRVTHHDTKISNVLFDAVNKGLCVIDLDTVMPGYFISDVGDMLRTYLSPVGEEETDFSAIEVREAYFEAIVYGYFSEMQDELTELEKEYFIYAGKFMVYMQALRFLTDYLNNDIYYSAKYEGHNLNRAINQLTLLNILTEKEEVLNKMVQHCLLLHSGERV